MSTFKKQLLYHNTKGYDRKLKSYAVACERATNLSDNAEFTLSRKLSLDEKLKLTREGIDFVIDEIKGRFQFKDAEDDFNYKALGIDISELQDAEAKYKPFRNDYVIAFNEGEACIDEKEKDRLYKSFNVYTTNEKQNEILKICNKIKSSFEEAESIGIVNRVGRNYIYNITKGLKLDFDEVSKDYKILINNSYILSN